MYSPQHFTAGKDIPPNQPPGTKKSHKSTKISKNLSKIPSKSSKSAKPTPQSAPKSLLSSVFTNPFFFLFIGILFQLIGAFGLYKWTKSRWMAALGRYTLQDWFGLSSFLLFSPLGFCILFISFQSLLRKTSSLPTTTPRIITTLFLLFYLAALCAFGWYWGWSVLKCGVVGCVNSDFHTWEPPQQSDISKPVPEMGIGFKTSIGIPIVITSTSLILVTILSLIEYCRNSAFHTAYAKIIQKGEVKGAFFEPLLLPDAVDTTSLHKNNLLKSYTPYNTHILSSSSTIQNPSMSDSSDTTKINLARAKIWLWFGFFTLFLTLWWFFSTYVPNSWGFFYAPRLAQKALVNITRDGDQCGIGEWFVCPEIPDATMVTQSITISKYLQLKIFPSNLIFYLFIFIWFLVAVAAKSINEPITRFFSTKVRVPIPGLPFTKEAHRRDRLAFFTYAEFFSFFFLSLTTYLFFHYWYFDHNFVQHWPGKDGVYHIALSERLSRALGQVAVLFFALLMFPAARNSPLLAMIGISWEASIQYHRWLGAIFFVFTIGHMICAYWWYYVSSTLKDIYQIPQNLPSSPDNFTIPLIQWVTWFSIISIGVFSLAWQQFRRQHFNIWKFLHHFTYLTMIPAILWHAASAWYYILPATTIWFFDRLVRAYRSVRAVNLVTALQASVASSERAHLMNVFSAASIDMRITTPLPITSIHHHKALTNATTSSVNAIDPINDSNELPGISGLIQGSSSFIQSSSFVQSSPSFVQSTSYISLNNSFSAPERSDIPPDPYSSSIASLSNVSGPGVRIIDRGEAGTYIELRIINDNMVYFPGHYAFINIAEISLFEWHPFTIASPAHSKARSEIVFVIKTMGVNTWTQSLYKYIEDHYKSVGASTSDFVDVPLTVSLDGPYGTPIDFTTYDVVILLGGGIGITPCKSIYESMLLSYLHDFKAKVMKQESHRSIGFNNKNNKNDKNNDHKKNKHDKKGDKNSTNNDHSSDSTDFSKRIHLMWSARDPTLFNLMDESLSQIPYGPFSAQLFCDNPFMSKEEDNDLLTSEESLIDPQITSLIRPGRPDLEAEFKKVVGELKDSNGGCDESDNVSCHDGNININNDHPINTNNNSTTKPSYQQKRVLVFVCGPTAMAKDAEIICQELGWDFHTETFAL